MPDDPMIKASTIEQWINEKLDAGQLQNKLTALGWEEETIHKLCIGTDQSHT